MFISSVSSQPSHIMMINPSIKNGQRESSMSRQSIIKLNSLIYMHIHTYSNMYMYKTES